MFYFMAKKPVVVHLRWGGMAVKGIKRFKVRLSMDEALEFKSIIESELKKNRPLLLAQNTMFLLLCV